MPTIEIPDIQIREIYVPDVPEIYTPHYLTITKPPDIDVPGCTYQHRDIKNTGNRNLLLDDPNGVYTTCDVPFPSFVPLDYTPENLVITEEVPVNNETPPLPESKQPEIPEVKEDKPIELEPCPSKKDQRVGDFRNEKRLERVIGHERGQDGVECITLYEDVPFVDQYIPEPSTIVSTAVIGLVAASSPLILNLIKPAIKNIVKKLTKKKDKVE
tara:strand:- start:195 stop:836 length:642 start_codon:yes stop_codon:yes gene_type:complete